MIDDIARDSSRSSRNLDDARSAERPAVAGQESPPFGVPASASSVIALQRAAGNAAVSRLLQRQPDPDPAPAPASAPPGAPEIDPKEAAIEGMRLTLPGLINKAYQDYSNAVSSVRSEIIAKKVETPPPTDPMNVLMAVGMGLVPWEAIAIKAISTIVTGPLREQLKGAVLAYFIRKNPLPFSPQTREDRAVDALAAAAGLLSEDDNLKAAYKGITAGWTELSKATVIGSTELQQTLSFLDGCIDEASKKALSGLTGKLADGEVAALWAAYANPSLSLAFRGSVRAQAQHFADVLAKKPAERGKTIAYRPIDAYGRRRWVKLHYNTTSARFFFLAWVPKDIEPIVAAANGGADAEPITSKEITGHLPDPVIEQERVVRMDAWGGLRLARVVGVEGVMYFRSWIPKNKYAEVEAEAQHQIGGLETVPADQVQDKLAPGPGD